MNKGASVNYREILADDLGMDSLFARMKAAILLEEPFEVSWDAGERIRFELTARKDNK